ncbi:MAG: DUF1844 domain-containing protein [Phycisphaerae bacterium]
MADDKKIFVDDDWKAEARREKERLAEAEQKRAAPADGVPSASFVELLNLLTMQALGGLGLLQMPGGERVPPNLEVAKHFIDILQVLEDKTKGNLNAEEKKFLDTTLYELRVQFVQRAGGGGMGSGPAPAGGPPHEIFGM